MKRILLALFIACATYLEAAQTHYFLLITGCGRSGTSYISEVLQKCGLDVPHETLGKDGTVSWPMAVPANTVPLAGMSRKPLVAGLNKCHFKHIFHQVRDPLRCISSCVVDFSQCWDFINTYIPQIERGDSPLTKSAKYWYYWNLKAEKLAEWTYRIEDIDHVWPELCRRLGYKLDKSNLKKVPRNTNSRGVFYRYTWVDLKMLLEPNLYQNIVKMARRYGYKIQ